MSNSTNKSHPLEPLNKKDLNECPFQQFAQWYQKAKEESGLFYPDAMCLSTVTANGFPEGRMVLLKEYNQKEFIFYTNTHSKKGHSLTNNARASLTVYWEKFRRQIRISGETFHIAEKKADDYFHSRDREAQIGAWASLQSEILESRQVLEKRVKEYTQKFEGKTVPRPPHWTGLSLQPIRFEFWQERPDRLHDRFEYISEKNKWFINRLYP